MFQLPTSRWSAIKDKIVNIPIPADVICQTIENLPRTPTEAGIIPVQLKRKKDYKNTHLYQYICPQKVTDALHQLKHCHKGYKDTHIIDLVENCTNSDPENIFLLEEHQNDEAVIEVDSTEDEPEAVKMNEEENERENEEENEENEYIAKDSIRKFQFDYDKSIGMSENFPESLVNTDEPHKVAPGEGHFPTNILQDKDWDVLGFPHLFKNGKFGLRDTKREKIFIRPTILCSMISEFR